MKRLQPQFDSPAGTALHKSSALHTNKKIFYQIYYRFSFVIYYFPYYSSLSFNLLEANNGITQQTTHMSTAYSCSYIYFIFTLSMYGKKGDLYINIQWSSFLLFGGDEERNRSRGI